MDNKEKTTAVPNPEAVDEIRENTAAAEALEETEAAEAAVSETESGFSKESPSSKNTQYSR